jgi:acyl-coenzyme A thioesterase PaaI-like protein
VIGWKAPYSGTIGGIVRDLEPGRAVVSLTDRRAVRNHLDSIHAVALTNLGELASGLALVTDLREGTRAIVTGLRIEFLKKARGRLVAVGSASAPPRADLDHGPVACVARAEIRDVEGEVVAILRADWQVGLQTPTPANPLPETGKSG